MTNAYRPSPWHSARKSAGIWHTFVPTPVKFHSDHTLVRYTLLAQCYRDVSDVTKLRIHGHQVHVAML